MENVENNPPAVSAADLGFMGMGTEDYMCPYCVTPWKCNGPHIPDLSWESIESTLVGEILDEIEHAVLFARNIVPEGVDTRSRVVENKIRELRRNYNLENKDEKNVV